MKFRDNLFALISIALFVYAGCESKSPDTSKQSEPVSAGAAATNPGSSPRDTNSEADRKSEKKTEPVVIDGDLAEIDWDSMVGQNVKITGDLVVVDTYDLIRRGQIKVARNRLYIPTNTIDPNDNDPAATSFEGGGNVAKVIAAQKKNDTGALILDDGPATENIFPPSLFPELGNGLATVRIGSVLDGVSGNLVRAGSNILLVPDQSLKWTPAQRPQRPDVGKAHTTVASFNVLNYFTTIDNGQNNARGADSQAEQTRQEAKIVAAILGLDADVIGLMEMENNVESEERLVAALNAELGQDVYQACGLPEGFRSAPGGQDAIRVGIIYRTDRIDTAGPVSMIDDPAFFQARTPIVQRFQPRDGGQPFTVVVNHFKSKGGADNADAANKNKGDGQGAYNATRLTQSLAICKFIDDLKQSDPEARVLVMGDLNAYGQEDPIDALRAKGLVDLRELFQAHESNTVGGGHYSYIYYGQSGSLDHAFATESLATAVTGTATWHINADEPRFLDYNQEFNPKPLYQADPYRSSDHDPMLIGIGK